MWLVNYRQFVKNIKERRNSKITYKIVKYLREKLNTNVTKKYSVGLVVVLLIINALLGFMDYRFGKIAISKNLYIILNTIYISSMLLVLLTKVEERFKIARFLITRGVWAFALLVFCIVFALSSLVVNTVEYYSNEILQVLPFIIYVIIFKLLPVPLAILVWFVISLPPITHFLMEFEDVE